MVKYKYFNKYILRTPVNSLQELNTPNISLDFFVNKNYFLQAVRLASPSLYNKFIKWKNSGLKSKEDEQRLLYSMYKYYTRSCTRCTPFGLFAGLNTGEIKDNNNIVLKNAKQHTPHTRLDMNYLCSLIQDLEKIPEIRNQLIYFANNSLYYIGNKIRYVEYTYINTNRKHQITSVENNKYLQKIINTVKTGATINHLVNVIIEYDNDINSEEAYDFINTLIDNQLLISNISPTVTGQELHDSLLNNLSKLKISNNHNLKILKQVKKELEELDKINPVDSINKYRHISNKLKKLNTTFEEKYLFQTDLILRTEYNCINKQLIKDIISGLKILNKLTIKPQETYLTRFKDAFYKRYEDREIPLVIALDTETGIGYAKNNSNISGDNTPLIDDIALPGTYNNTHKLNWNKNQSFLFKKYLDAIKTNKHEIIIKDEELKDYIENWDDLPTTISTMVEIYNIDNEYKIFMNNAGGSSAVNLLGRFAHADNTLSNYIKKITQKEKEQNKDKLLAEIVHLPESRVGNILSRPIFREYEIPYLANSSVETKYQIPVSDIMISIKKNRIFLRSRKFNKEIKPHLSNAHNYSNNALPIYHFLADMQTQDVRAGISFNWGNLENEYDFLPRVIYKNIIFSKATWIVKKDEYKDIIPLKNTNEIYKKILKLFKRRNIPQEVVLADGDNELYINTNNITSINMLFSLIKKRSSFKLKEFLFSNNTNYIVKDKNNNIYTNQFIFSFYKENNA